MIYHMKSLLIFVFTCTLLWGQATLKEEYTFSSNTIYSDELVQNIKKVFPVVEIPDKRMVYRIKSDELVEAYAKEGIRVKASAAFITFKRTFFFDTVPIENALIDFYSQYYPNIHIETLHVTPRSYIEMLPESYDITIPPKNHLHYSGILYLSTPDGQRIFFNYTIDATLRVLKTTRTIARKEALSSANTTVVTQRFEGYRDAPLAQIENGKWQAKMRLAESRVITPELIETIPLIKRNQQVVAIIKDGTLEIEFAATANDDGALYDMITITKNDGETLKARIIGANRVEIK